MKSISAALLTLALIGSSSPASASGADVVLHTASASVIRGHWAATTSSTAAGGRALISSDQGWSSLKEPLTSPADFFELTFDAPAATTYRVWLRLRATADSKWNDAVWVQFSDSTLVSGTAAYRIGSASGLMVNLERCSGCGVAGWGWQNTAYWLTQATQVRFASSGRHTIRVQTREDGVEIDQIVLSPVKYAAIAPGASTNDNTIVAPPNTDDRTPYRGLPFSLPGLVDAADFDNGGQGVAYGDTTSGNAGTVYRSTDVDVQSASCGGHNVGWTIAGEWLKYSVTVATAASYEVQLRVAAAAPATIDVSIGNASVRFDVPNTGGWQNWHTVSLPISLAAGAQTMTVTFTSGGANLRSINVVAQQPIERPEPGGAFRMMTWNVHHGKDKRNVLSVPAQAAYIAQQQAQVVVLQEVQTWDQNQPAMFEAELEKRTGVNWTRVWAPVNANAGTEGNLVLTTLPVSSVATFKMHATSDWNAIGPNRSVAQATVAVGGVLVDVFSTHLDYANSTYRTAQLIDLMAWLERFRARRVVGGDFNATPGTYWINTMTADYYDTWQDIMGTASGGGTINGVRFDYLFRSKLGGETVRPTRVSVLTTTLSDHSPVVADYWVTP